MKTSHLKASKLPQLTISQLNKLKDLFAHKNWPIVEDDDISVFERFYRTLLMLDNDQQDFLIKLTYNFDHVPLSNYLQYMEEPLKQLRKESGNNTLLFLTCTPKQDVGCVKSSAMVLYQLKGTTLKQHVDLAPKCVVENIQRVSEYPINDKTTIVLVDDFVGTGETALAAVDYVHELLPQLKDNSKIVVFSIVALKEGVERLNRTGLKTYFSIEKRKAITEDWDSIDRPSAKAMMEGIEMKLNKLKDEFRFGYKGSEALVCMERCPNNTFPIYWLQKNTAPYER